LFLYQLKGKPPVLLNMTELPAQNESSPLITGTGGDARTMTDRLLLSTHCLSVVMTSFTSNVPVLE
jgi:hypothetical protein